MKDDDRALRILIVCLGASCTGLTATLLAHGEYLLGAIMGALAVVTVAKALYARRP